MVQLIVVRTRHVLILYIVETKYSGCESLARFVVSLSQEIKDKHRDERGI